MYECDKNQMPYYNEKSCLKSNFWEFWAIDKLWPTLDKFYYFQDFISEKKNFKCLYKIWNKIISLDMKKKGEM